MLLSESDTNSPSWLRVGHTSTSSNGTLIPNRNAISVFFLVTRRHPRVWKPALRFTSHKPSAFPIWIWPVDSSLYHRTMFSRISNYNIGPRIRAWPMTSLSRSCQNSRCWNFSCTVEHFGSGLPLLREMICRGHFRARSAVSWWRDLAGF